MTHSTDEQSNKNQSMPEVALQAVEPMSPSAEREHKILKFWKDNRIFEKSLEKDAPHGNFVFYDGPPYATGLPHYGNLLPSIIKDVIPRYKTMRGYRVPRRWGWDCHGLPIENLIEKELGLQNKKQIEEYGVDKFNLAARNSVLRYADEWKQIIPRVGRWVDMENDYRSMDSSFMESVMWSFKQLHEKGLVYEGYKVMPFCPRCQTTLANFEVSQGYKDITDISAYVKFEVIDLAAGNSSASDESEMKTYVLAWTTTPWTLPGNVALAVNAEIIYVKVHVRKDDGSEEQYILAKDKLALIKGEYKIVEEMTGLQLAGTSYKPVFGYYENPGSLHGDHESKRDNGWKIYTAPFVTATDGTGIVHIAPAFGEDDMKLAKEVNLPVIHHVSHDGTMKVETVHFAGMTAKPKGDHQKTDIEVIKELALRGALFSKEKFIHSYPHCWRCDTPLLNFATSSWFVKVTSIKDRLVEENNKISWTPKEIGEGRFGKWLEGARDWAVSRSRYWGSPLPVWKAEGSGKVELIGSVAELKEKLPNNGNNFILMRHGESEANVRGIINSKDTTVCGLTEKGKDEVRKSASELKEKGVTVIYASDFKRTKETAQLVAETLGLDSTKIIYDARLHEIDGGDFEGGSWLDRNEYLSKFKDKLWQKVPGGESVADVKKRVAEFLYEIETKHQNQDILVVTHGLPIRVALQVTEGKTLRDMQKTKWQDLPDPTVGTASIHPIDFKPLPHNEDFELDLHRPYIDAVTWKNAEGETMRRVPEVFDVWYDSGSMSFAQQHYPFEHADAFMEKGSSMFPADFIAEGLDQTRGWFYLLLVLSVALFDKAPFKKVIVNGLILAEDGRKMSKSLKNYPDLVPTIEKFGADAFRYYMMSSQAVRAEDLAFSEKGLDEINKKLFNRLGNVYTFFETYAVDHVGTFERPETTNLLDQWILARLNELVLVTTSSLEKYELDRASRPILDFADDLSTWYLRRSRDRYKGDDVADKKQAIETTSYVFYVLSLVMAPFTPFYSEETYQKLTKGLKKESVHLENWPTAFEMNEEIISNMSAARKVVEAGLALRSKSNMKVRQPLAEFKYGFTQEIVLTTEYEAIIADELNVKKVSKLSEEDMKDAENGMKVWLDSNLTPDLIEEGKIRELMRAIQDVRKKIGLSPTDKISLTIISDSNTKDLIEKYKTDLSKSVQAEKLVLTDAKSDTEVTLTQGTANEGGGNDSSQTKPEEIVIDDIHLSVVISRI